MDRILDLELMSKFRQMKCVIKCKTPWVSVSGHHIKSRGSWGPDLEINLIPLCFYCHTKIHQYGLNKMITNYPELAPVLFSKGWSPEETGTGRNLQIKWQNPKLNL